MATDITYDEKGPRSFIVLGHELIHAWRDAHGTPVSSIAASPFAKILRRLGVDA